MATIEDVRRSLEQRLDEVESELSALRNALAAMGDEGIGPRRQVAAGPTSAPRGGRSRRRQRQPRRTGPVSRRGDERRASAVATGEGDARPPEPDTPSDAHGPPPSKLDMPTPELDTPVRMPEAPTSAPDPLAGEPEVGHSAADGLASATDALRGSGNALPVDTDALTAEEGEGSGGNNEAVLEFFESWPERSEAEQWAQELVKLSRRQLAKLREYVEQEIVRRREGRPVGFTINAGRGAPTPSSQGLINAGMVRLADGRLRLTDRGRAAGRLLVRRRADEAPPWWDSVMASALEPASTRPPSPGPERQAS